MARYRTEWLLALTLAVVTCAVYGHVLENDFVDFDDGSYITKNPNVLGGLSWAGVRWAFTTTAASNWHPLTWLSLQADASLSQLLAGCPDDPRVYHLTNLLLHTATTVLLFGALRALTGAVWPSAVVAALFAWHPLHVESVAWAAERKDVLSALFWMLTLLAYAGYVRRPGMGRYLLVALGLGLGLLAKPMLVTLPCVLLLLDYWPLDRLWPRQDAPVRGKGKAQPTGPGLRWLVWEKLPLFALAATSSAVTWYAQQTGGAMQALEHLPFGVRSANAVLAYVAYLRKAILPTDLAILYPHPREAISAAAVAGAALFLLAVTALVVSTRRTRPYFMVGWLWYLGTLVPVIGLVQVGQQALADRYTYLPLIGVFVMLAWAGADLLKDRPAGRIVLVPATAVVLLYLLTLTWLQVGTWTNSYTLWSQAVAATGANATAHNNLGTILQNDQNFAEARRHYDEALRIDPSFPLAHNNLGWVHMQQGDHAAARRHLETALQHDPKLGQAHNALGALSVHQGKAADAEARFAEALRLDPNDWYAHHGLGDVRRLQGKLEEAAASYRQAARLAPPAEAAVAHGMLAGVLYDDRQPEAARQEYRAAVRLKPTWPEGITRQAWKLAAHPNAALRNGREAVFLARQLVQAAETERAEDLDVLAAAYAEAGRYGDAVTAARRAQDLAATQPELARQIGARLRLYEARQPYRQPSAGGTP